MTVKDWGNTDLSRQQQVAPEPATSSISYPKLYLTIVAAILTAFFIMAVVSMIISAAMFNAVMSEFYPQTQPTTYQQQQQNSSAFQRDLDKLANQTAQKAIEPFQKEIDRQTKLIKQQTAAKQSDVQTCNFWLTQYEKEKSDRNKMHVNSACKRAHGALWNGID